MLYVKVGKVKILSLFFLPAERGSVNHINGVHFLKLLSSKGTKKTLYKHKKYEFADIDLGIPFTEVVGVLSACSLAFPQCRLKFCLQIDSLDDFLLLPTQLDRLEFCEIILKDYITHTKKKRNVDTRTICCNSRI